MSVQNYNPTGRAVIEDDVPVSPGDFYRTTLAYKMDEALIKGGELLVIAEQLGINPRKLREHIKSRTRRGKWRLIMRLEKRE
jgi:hypothetical protein